MSVVSPARPFVSKSSALTAALLSPSNERISTGERVAIRERLLGGLEIVANREEDRDRRAEGGDVKLCVTDYFLRSSLSREGVAGFDSQRRFRWSAMTAQRMIGTAAVRMCLLGLARNPRDAVMASVGQFISDANEGRAGPRSMPTWLATLSNGGVAGVCAGATTWATQLFNSLDWTRFETPPVVAPPDQWFNIPGTSRVSMRSRVDVRSEVRTVVDSRGGSASHDRESWRSESSPVLFVIKGGSPRETSRVELALPALVATVSRPTSPSPVRVVGWWPQCGQAMVLAVDRRAMEWASDEVLRAVSRASAPLVEEAL
ncbi:MAG: hypothetical protein M1134_01080 [Actinobacteria bacterium]|nr:hypothetical protein [Actinomycetota bacterium]